MFLSWAAVWQARCVRNAAPADGHDHTPPSSSAQPDRSKPPGVLRRFDVQDYDALWPDEDPRVKIWYCLLIGTGGLTWPDSGRG